MGAVLQIICALLIVGAVVFFVHRNKEIWRMATAGQKALAVFQIIFCGLFFSLCISDFLDVPVNFSAERLCVNIFYIIAFLSIAVYILFHQFKESDAYFKGVIWAYLILILVQCFVFPYGTEDAALRVFENVEGAVIFGLLIAVLLRLEDAKFCRIILFTIIVLELIVAVENVIVPFRSIIDDFQLIDIPLNYAALFMRPALFVSLAMAYHVRIERR